MQKMTLKYGKTGRRFIEEHHDACTECHKPFVEGETTHLGRLQTKKLAYVGDCCSTKLVATIARHVHMQRVYAVADKNVVIWRFMDLTKFISMTKQRALFFSRADHFDDPFEGAKGLLKNKRRWDKFYKEFFIEAYKNPPPGVDFDKTPKELQSEAKRLLESLDTSGKKSLAQTFINCWHENPFESEAMWRLYTSTLDQGIAVRSTVDRLYRSLGRDPSIQIGRVTYIDYSKRFVGINDAFWFKRKSFEHEREIRAVTRRWNEDLESGVLLPVKLDILIDRVYLSPTSQEWFKELVLDLMRKYELKKRVTISDMIAKPFH